MKSVSIFTALIFFIIPSSFAQDSSSTSLKKSMFALQFQVGNNFTLTSFQGSTLSCKYHVFDESAIRVGIGYSGNFETYREEANIEKNGSESFSITLNAQFIHYVKTLDDVSLFIGGGPQYYRRLYKSQTPSSYVNSWSLGVSGVLGVEWFFKKNMSLSGEYGILIYYKEETGYYYSNSPTTVKSINTTNYNMLKFGLSVYI